MSTNGIEHFSSERPNFGHSQLRSPEAVKEYEGGIVNLKTRLRDGWKSEEVLIERVVYKTWAWVRYLERDYSNAAVTTPLSLWSVVPTIGLRWVTDTYLEASEMPRR